jgi:hypothetical protein
MGMCISARAGIKIVIMIINIVSNLHLLLFLPLLLFLGRVLQARVRLARTVTYVLTGLYVQRSYILCTCLAIIEKCKEEVLYETI